MRHPQAYVEAWKSYDREQIGELFTADVRYRYHPYDDPVAGREAVVRSWLGEAGHAGASARDEPGAYDASYRAVAVDGDVAVATGSTSYLAGPGGPVQKVYDNCFVMRFDPAGRCREFTEWYKQRPRKLTRRQPDAGSTLAGWPHSALAEPRRISDSGRGPPRLPNACRPRRTALRALFTVFAVRSAVGRPPARKSQTKSQRRPTSGDAQRRPGD